MELDGSPEDVILDRDPQFFFAAQGGFFNHRLFVLGKADEQDSKLTSLLVELLTKPVGTQIPVQDVDIEIGISGFDTRSPAAPRPCSRFWSSKDVPVHATRRTG